MLMPFRVPRNKNAESQPWDVWSLFTTQHNTVRPSFNNTLTAGTQDDSSHLEESHFCSKSFSLFTVAKIKKGIADSPKTET